MLFPLLFEANRARWKPDCGFCTQRCHAWVLPPAHKSRRQQWGSGLWGLRASCHTEMVPSAGDGNVRVAVPRQAAALYPHTLPCATLVGLTQGPVHHSRPPPRSPTGAFCIPLYVPYVLTGRWSFGRGLCKLWLVVDYLLCTSSVFNIVLISYDRFLSVTRAVSPVMGWAASDGLRES